MGQQIAVIIGAGPAGLTAALELIRQTKVKPIVLEASAEVGGISRTVCHNGNRMDLGGHRFFSKSDWVMNWWQEILPIDAAANASLQLTYQNKQTSVQVAGAAAGDDDRRMLVRGRLSRIFFLRRFFDYPIKMNAATAGKLGLWRLAKVAATYGWITLFPRRPERNLEDFMINRFGRELYETFFKDYTHKVWGIPCDQISADWGAQRIKGLNISKALWHAARQLFKRKDGVAQKGTETSLIEQFLYPKFGPGQMWQEVARLVTEGGGEIRYRQAVTGVETRDGRVVAVTGTDHASGQPFRIECEHAISTMPVRELVKGMNDVPPEVRQVADGLMYRDFLTVGLLVRKADVLSANGQALPDNWIYIQEKDVRIGRLQIFNNWSPHLVKDADTMWMGLEYFCNEDDDLWRMDDAAMIRFGAAELAKIGMLKNTDVLDGTVVRVPKAYPAYFGSYDRFDVVRRYTDGFSNLYLVGRNGMHRYNNQDHSMLTAKLAVEAIASGAVSKAALWDVNIDDEYHEEKK
jgi:protoporphyrinogen oxidase